MADSKKIFFFFPLSSIGGTEFVHLDVVKVLKGYDPEIYIRYSKNKWKGLEYCKTKESEKEGKALLKEFEKSGKVIYSDRFLEARRFGRLISYWFTRSLATKINKSKHPVVVFWHRESIEFLWPYLAEHVKIVDIVHNNSNNEYPDANYLVNNWVPRINRRVLVSKGLKKWLYLLYSEENYPEEYKSRISVIQHMVDFPVEGFIEKSTQVLNVLFVGRDAMEKRFELILEIAKCLEHSNTNIKFHVVGPKHSKYKDVAPANITWYGEISDRSIQNTIYKLAHVILLTSSSEGFPKVFAEGMAFSCVPLTTAVGGIPDQLKQEENALFTEKDNCVDQSVNYLLKLENDQELYKQLSRNAYLYARDHFDPELFKHDWNRLISTID